VILRMKGGGPALLTSGSPTVTQVGDDYVYEFTASGSIKFY
jgi:hypothetical protein